MAGFGPKPWINPFGKISFFQLFEPFFMAWRGVFFVLEYCKLIFLTYIVQKQKDDKMAYF